MCVAFLLFDTHPRHSLIIASNRDEYFARPAQPAHFWEDSPQIFAGRDKEAGGTWFGISRNGRVALLTNYREASCIRNAPSRGKLTRDFLEGTWSPLAYLQQLPIADYNGYNLIVGDLRSMQLAYGSNRGETAVHGPRLLAPGVYGLSNAVLDTPWPKVETGKAKLSAMLAATHSPLSWPRIVAEVLCDTGTVEDARLPVTEASEDVERKLCSIFIDTTLERGEYGTSTQTVMAAQRGGEAVEWYERFLDASRGGARDWQESHHVIKHSSAVSA